MSNTVQGIVSWLRLPPTEKAVMNALADSANDDGVSWIAVRSRKPHKLDLTIKTGFGERAVQGAIARLCAIPAEEGGHLTRDERPGRGVIYTIHPRGRSVRSYIAAAQAPPQEMRGAGDAGAHLTASTPAPAAGNPSVTIKVVGSRARASIPDILALGVTAEQWADFEAMRRKKRAPLTPGAIDLAHRRLVKLADAGHPPGDVVDQSTFHGWAGLFELKDDANGHRIDHAGTGPHNSMVGAAIDSIHAEPD